jgi:hypothetical protein
MWAGAGIAAAVVAGAALIATRSQPVGEGSPAPLAVAAARQPGDLVVYKSPTCGCCSGWIDHMRAAGFRIVERDTSDVGAVKQRLGVLPTLTSCHTAVIHGYVIEGHVPADDVVRLLEERPKIVGIAVPGMPAGSPGMESAQPWVSYDVVAFDSTGKTSLFAKH